MAGNVLLLTDSYKISHWKQYPPGTEFLYTYFESRGGRFPDFVFFGLQYTLKKYLRGSGGDPRSHRGGRRILPRSFWKREPV